MILTISVIKSNLGLFLNIFTIFTSFISETFELFNIYRNPN